MIVLALGFGKTLWGLLALFFGIITSVCTYFAVLARDADSAKEKTESAKRTLAAHQETMSRLDALDESNQESNTASEERIKSHQEELAQHTSQEMGKGKDEILEAIRLRNESLQEKLEKEFSFGYILFKPNKNGAWTPQARGDVEIDLKEWPNFQLEIDRTSRQVSVSIPSFQVTLPGAQSPNFSIFGFSGTFGYFLGVPLLTLLETPTTKVVVQIVDDSPENPTWVIGLLPRSS
jgi:hypothetical protein